MNSQETGQNAWWNKKLAQQFADQYKPRSEDINDVWKFLHLRKDADGDLISQKLGEPTKTQSGWWVFPFNHKSTPPLLLLNSRDADIKLGWHGTKMEALYSICRSERLTESRDTKLGECLKKNCSGVYLFKAEFERESDAYVRFAHLCNDGVFWGCKIRVRYDKTKKNFVDEKKITVQPGSSVQIEEIWLKGIPYNYMPCNTWVTTDWKAEFEARPKEENNSSRVEHSYGMY